MQISVAVSLILASAAALTAELKHPATRDEDIAGATVASTVSRMPDGKYRYVYTIRNPSTSTADLLYFKLDVHCPNMPGGPKREEDDAGYTRDGNYSDDSRHVPLVSKIVGLGQRMADIMPDNVFQTMIGLGPGDERVVAVTSPNRPGYVPFSLDLSSNNEVNYDYVDESQPNVWKYDIDTLPWYEDWKVQGLVKGPACPGEEATPVTRPVFKGQWLEHRDLNRLLSYEIAGNRNRWYAPATQNEVSFTIHYDGAIKAETFKATLNGQDIRSRFKPIPLTSEKVTLPLSGARTEIELSVQPIDSAYKDEEKYGDRTDVDLFTIRRKLPPTP